jgi:hypothetical protein
MKNPNEKIVSITFNEMDPYDGSLMIEDNILFTVNEQYADDEYICKAYKVYDSIWDSGNEFDTFDDFIENAEYTEFEELDKEIQTIIEENFDELNEIITEWSIETYLKVFKFLYPEANANEINIDKKHTFEW